ncbi:uroporphyrinogen-III synthase [Chitinophaga costaii]|uniref:Uroporphyrinogen-III synthase n=1 Tax=Chitinophaga costaii TaxID=1335309 RepID=A0A1C4D639_9BACT|nr:uroporphyrinogen-III synthase [Chitinophaga costaii]PUZ24466.1 uroporphyrinogen-III synthase [Chitinophaga costaii]SCC26670.1 uroporphyrinogen-III synthase [Chitinophaga costaii]
MLNKPFRILSTKVLSPGVAGLATRAGVQLDMLDFIDISLLADEAVAGIVAAIPAHALLVFTSANAARAFAHITPPHHHWQIACLEGATRAALPEQATVVLTAPHADALATQLLEFPALKEVYYLCGDQRRDTIPTRLRENGIHVSERIVYHNTATPQKINNHYDALLFFSPTAVKSFFSVNALPSTTRCFAIGHTTGAALQATTHNDIITADNPAAATLLQMAIDHLEHHYNSNA